MSDVRPIEKLHLTMTAPDGRTLAIVTYTDGRCVVICDGQPVKGMDWPLDQMDRCTAALLRLARK